SGMRVRLAFAVAAFLEPDILVIDEVLAVGDAEFQKKAIGKMQDISKGDGRTVLFVSHNMAAVKSLCTRAIVLEHGKTVFEGAVEIAINKYLDIDKTSLDFTYFKDRKGNGEIKIIEASVSGFSEEQVPQSSKKFKIKFKLENLNRYNATEVAFDIRIDDNIGQRIAWLSTTLLERNSNNIVEFIIFEIEKLNLNKGVYYVTTFILVNNELSDWIQNAFSFEVVEGDYYGTGKLVPSHQSKVLMDFKVEYL
ncbi:Wzt carbohydrate-binding domain-containing protein, partial [Bizionia paragorgiae]|uniref:Wzt carbohydrate-binding domain-containing protein n=2 Tax=Flavobacteriaceae TaxID=49546 RepID=UPI003A8CCE19